MKIRGVDTPETLKLRPDLHQKLTLFAQKNHNSKSEVVRLAISLALESKDAPAATPKTKKVSYRDPDRLTYKLQKKADRLGVSAAALITASLERLLDE